jgi:hypothetical protein
MLVINVVPGSLTRNPYAQQNSKLYLSLEGCLTAEIRIPRKYANFNTIRHLLSKQPLGKPGRWNVLQGGGTRAGLIAKQIERGVLNQAEASSTLNRT